MPFYGMDYWILGSGFFRGYYVTHDDMLGRIGISPQHESFKVEIVYDTKVYKSLSPSISTNKHSVTLSILLSVLLLYGLYLAVPKVLKWFITPDKDLPSPSELQIVILD